MTKPVIQYPLEKYPSDDWRRDIILQLMPGPRPIYYLKGAGRLFTLSEREFEFLAGIFADELGRRNRVRAEKESAAFPLDGTAAL